MRHKKRAFKIGKSMAEKKAVLANMACSLIEEGQIKTTLPRAKEMRKTAERAITLGKRGTLHARRQAIKKLRNPDTVHYLFERVAGDYMDRPGGYTRILKLGPREGDGAEMCLVELVESDDGGFSNEDTEDDQGEEQTETAGEGSE